MLVLECLSHPLLHHQHQMKEYLSKSKDKKYLNSLHNGEGKLRGAKFESIKIN